MKYILSFAVGLISFASHAVINDSPADKDPVLDISVLKAFVHYDLNVGSIVDLSRCEKISSTSGREGQKEAFNCAWELANKMGGTPMYDRVIVRTINGQMESENFKLPVIEIQTVIPVDRLENADLIGFSTSFMGGGMVTYRAKGPNGQTREIAQVTLRDGRRGIVHKFITPFNPSGGVGNCTIRTVPFKPFFAVTDSQGNQTRYWDRMKGEGYGTDYVLTNFDYQRNNSGCTSGKDSIDQTAALLR